MSAANKLTPAAARSAMPGTILRDDDVPGLALHCGATRKTWKLFYRTKTRVARRPALGTFPALSIEAARRAAREILEKVAAGRDPSGEWRLAREAPTVADACKLYLDEWAPRHKAASSVKEDRRQIEAMVLKSELARMRIAEVEKPHVDAFLADVEARRWAGDAPRGPTRERAPGAANRARALLSKLFTLAETDWKMRPQGHHPVKGTRKRPMALRKVHASPELLPKLAEALEFVRPGFPHAIAAIHVMLLTGARPDEIRSAPKEGLQGNRLVLTKHKTQRVVAERVVILPRAALDVIEAMPPVAGPYLFGRVHTRHAWELVRQRAGCPLLQMRDLRRTFATAAKSGGVTLDQIAELFGHTSSAVTKRYAWIFETTAEAKAEATADALAGMMQKKGA